MSDRVQTIDHPIQTVYNPVDHVNEEVTDGFCHIRIEPCSNACPCSLNLADNTDAKLETMTEVLENAGSQDKWLGFNRFFDSNLRKTD